MEASLSNKRKSALIFVKMREPSEIAGIRRLDMGQSHLRQLVSKETIIAGRYAQRTSLIEESTVPNYFQQALEKSGL